MGQKPLIIFGAGELAEVAAYYFDNDSCRRIEAFTIDGNQISETVFLDRPVEAFETIAETYPPEIYDLFVAVGYSRVNALRMEKCELARTKGYELVSYVSPNAYVANNVDIGWNCLVLEDNTIQPFVHIGNGVTLWSGNHIGHHAQIGDYAFISSHVVISGGVKVGEQTFIGVNATTTDHIAIGARCVIGAGSLIAKDVPDECVIVAKPAKLSTVPSHRLRHF